MYFHNPEYFFLLLLLIPMAAWRYMRRPRVANLTVASTQSLRKLPFQWRVVAMTHLPFVLRMVSLVLLTLILARPQTNSPLTEKETQGIDIMLCMDVSVSMLTADLEPNRIEAAKEVAIEFISGRPNDNIGLTLFGGEAFTQCPMTTDHQSLLSLMGSVNCELQRNGIISDGTAIGMGLTNSVSRLAQSKTPSKVVILITDGANNAGDISPLMAADIAKSSGVRVYTIAVGHQGKVKQPVAILPNGEYYYQVVESDMDPETLKKIAAETGGLYYAADSNEKLRAIYHDIDQLEKSKLKVKHYDRHYEAFMPFAWALLACLLLEILLRFFTPLPIKK